MTKRNAEKWIAALRSGKYAQTKNILNNENGFCCLGVACKIFIPLKKLNNCRVYKKQYVNGWDVQHQPHAPKWLLNINGDVRDKLGASLSDANDGDMEETNFISYSFNEIADLIQAIYIEKVLGI